MRTTLFASISILLFFNSISAHSQSLDKVTALAIDPYHLTVGFSKTTNLVFPFAIKSIDKGSNALLVQKANGVENILQIKAAFEHFKETNLTVITAEGKLYSFLLNFETHPAVLTLVFEPEGSAVPAASILSEGTNEVEIQRNANRVALTNITVSGIRDRKHGITFALEGIFIYGEVMYYKLKVQNDSNIKYDIDQLRFFIRDRKKAKRTAIQEIEINPLQIDANRLTVEGQSQQSWVYALPKFTLPDKKYLKVQLMEKNGGRNLELKIKNRTLIRSKVLD